jgi:uncharacterized metal-binding protein YceD (DUF177 family)
MPLLVNLQHLLRHSLTLRGELPAEELDLGVHDAMIQANSPLAYDLEVEKLEQALLVQGRLRLKLDCQCVRCLKPIPVWLDLQSWAAHLPLTGEDAVPVVNDCVDLTPQIREDILLGFPQHPVCEPECAGLSGAAGGPSKAAAEESKAPPSSAWSELDKLKL